MKHLCYKNRKQLISIYGEQIGSILHKILVDRRMRNKLLGVEENWWTFILYPASGHLLIASYCK